MREIPAHMELMGVRLTRNELSIPMIWGDRMRDTGGTRSLADRMRFLNRIPPEVLEFTGSHLNDRFSSVFNHHMTDDSCAHGADIRCFDLRPGDEVIHVEEHVWGKTVMQCTFFHRYGECPWLDYTRR